jgi:hypothetical protein
MESGKWAHCRRPRRGCQSRFHGLIRGEFNNPSGIKRATAINEASSLLSTPEAIMGLVKPECLHTARLGHVSDSQRGLSIPFAIVLSFWPRDGRLRSLTVATTGKIWTLKA